MSKVRFTVVFIGIAISLLIFQNCQQASSNKNQSNQGNLDSIGDNQEPFVFDPQESYEKLKCSFSLTGQGGYQWRVERYTDVADDCKNEIPTVTANNPDATVELTAETYVYDSIDLDEKYKCEFSLEGQKGYAWKTERYAIDEVGCDLEFEEVRKNNPLAKVSNVARIFVHDPTTGTEKWKCEFSLTGPQGFQWQTERYVSVSDDCKNFALQEAQQNNPNAEIEMEVVFVQDLPKL